jgi:CheY-like chemotaxis protein
MSSLSQESSTSMANVLVADDDEFSRHLLAAELRDAGHRVYEAHDGKEALDFFVASAPHAVITDLQMPRMGGHELISELRKIGATIPVIAVSGGGTDMLATALELGADLCFSKPFDCANLINLLTPMLSLKGEDQEKSKYVI